MINAKKILLLKDLRNVKTNNVMINTHQIVHNGMIHAIQI